MMNIYLGNLPEDITEDEVRSLFAAHGEVVSVTLMANPENGRPRGFGFVEMAPEAAAAAIADLDGFMLRGEMLRVNEARDRGAKAPRRSW